MPIPSTNVPARRDWETVDGSFIPEDCGSMLLLLSFEKGLGKDGRKEEDSSGDSSRLVRCGGRLRLLCWYS